MGNSFCLNCIVHIKPETIRVKAEQKKCWKEFAGEELGWGGVPDSFGMRIGLGGPSGPGKDGSTQLVYI